MIRMGTCICKHDQWDHEYEESFDGENESCYWLGCEVEGCDCIGFESGDD